MTAADIDAIREQLKEVGRYLCTDDATCQRMINDALGLLYDPKSSRFDELRYRVRANLKVAMACTRVDIDVSRGYLAGAIHELGCLRSELERAEKRDGKNPETPP